MNISDSNNELPLESIEDTYDHQVNENLDIPWSSITTKEQLLAKIDEDFIIGDEPEFINACFVVLDILDNPKRFLAYERAYELGRRGFAYQVFDYLEYLVPLIKD